MLLSLYIKNYAIIDEINLRFPQSLTTITGETGSGKSILLGALGLILGNRADSDKLFKKDQKCIVEATFQITRDQVKYFFDEYDFDYEEQLILRREINSKGKSRAFINDTPALLKELRILSRQLIQQHQQFDTMEIIEPSYQLRLVDALADHEDILKDYGLLYKQRKEIINTLENLKDKQARASKEQDYIEFQLKEIKDLNISRDELLVLDEEFTRLQNADEIIELLSMLTSTLTGSDHAIAESLRELKSNITRLAQYLPKGGEIIERIEGTILELEDLAQYAYEIGDGIDNNPLKLEDLRLKIDKVQQLVKKHQLAEYEEIFTIKSTLHESLKSLEDTDSEIIALQRELHNIDEKLHAIAKIIHKNRVEVIPDLETEVKTLLSTLAMPYARFSIDLKEVEGLGIRGKDSVNFLFNANKGGDMHLLKNVASGGEMSRLALVLNSLVAKSMTLPTLIFDEIDSGVSGDVALKMGKILKDFAADHQVIVITHSPQIAAQGNLHYYVSKRTDKHRTYAEIHEVRNEERIKIIAIMLSQNPPSEAAQKNAEELLNYKFI